MEEKDLIQIKIEEAKVVFILAEISIIFAGFMFASSGIYWTTMVQTMEYNTNINNKVLDLTLHDYSNLTKDYIQKSLNLSTQLVEFTKSQSDLYKISFYLGWIFSAISILGIGLGKYLISKLKKHQ